MQWFVSIWEVVCGGAGGAAASASARRCRVRAAGTGAARALGQRSVRREEGGDAAASVWRCGNERLEVGVHDHETWHVHWFTC